MSDTITPEQQRAWDNYQLALMAYRDREFPTEADATHAIGVVFDPPAMRKRPVRLRTHLAAVLDARLSDINEAGAELAEEMSVTGSSARLPERIRNEACMAGLKAEFALASLALRATKGGSLTWR